MQKDIDEILAENGKLKRDILLLQQSLQQAKYVKKAYDDSVKLLKQKDKLLKQQLAKTTAIFNSQSSIVVITNGRKIVDINKAFFENYNYTDLKDFVAKHACICELFVNKKNSIHLMPSMYGQNWVDYVKLNPQINHEVYLVDKFENEKIYNVTTGDGLMTQNELNEEVVVFADITELKKQSALLYSQSRLVAMGEMVSMIAHQWRQPLASLNTILARLEIQIEFGMYDEHSFSKAFKSSSELIQYMTKTIDDFANFFKSSTQGKIIEICELIDKPKRLMETLFKSNNTEFETNYLISKNTKININASQFDQIVLNIYKNALDEFKRREIQNSKISITVQSRNNRLKVLICDNAGGISEEIIGRIFEPYFSTKSKNGMGIGLYMSKIIAENYLGGKLNAHNIENGVCFEIEVPYVDA